MIFRKNNIHKKAETILESLIKNKYNPKVSFMKKKNKKLHKTQI